MLFPPNVVTPVPPWFTPTVPVEVKFFAPSVNTTLLAVSPEKLTVEDAFKVVVETPVAPVIAPAPLMLIDGVERNLSYPVPKFKALNILFAIGVTFEKLIPFCVFVPEVAVPVNPILNPFVVTEPEVAALVSDSKYPLSLLVDVE